MLAWPHACIGGCNDAFLIPSPAAFFLSLPHRAGGIDALPAAEPGGTKPCTHRTLSYGGGVPERGIEILASAITIRHSFVKHLLNLIYRQFFFKADHILK
jgi:hypothetical protein